MVLSLRPRSQGGKFRNVAFFLNHTSHTLSLSGSVARPKSLARVARGLPDSSLLRRYLRKGDIALFKTEAEAIDAHKVLKSVGIKIRKTLTAWYDYLEDAPESNEDNTAADKKAKADKEAADKKAKADKEAADKKAKADKEAADKKAKADKEAADKKAKADKEAADKKAETDKEAADKEAADKKAKADKEAADKKAKADKEAADKEAKEKAAKKPKTKASSKKK